MSSKFSAFSMPVLRVWNLERLVREKSIIIVSTKSTENLHPENMGSPSHALEAPVPQVT